MKSFHETFPDRIDPADGTAVLTEAKFIEIQKEAVADFLVSCFTPTPCQPDDQTAGVSI